MLPQFKPVMAVAIIAGVAFGGETGFLVGCCHDAGLQRHVRPGAMDALADVLLWGIIGFLAGVLFRKGLAPAQPEGPCAYTAHFRPSLFTAASWIRSSALMWSSEPELEDHFDLLRVRLPHELHPCRRHLAVPVVRRGAHAGEAGAGENQIQTAHHRSRSAKKRSKWTECIRRDIKTIFSS